MDKLIIGGIYTVDKVKDMYYVLAYDSVDDFYILPVEIIHKLNAKEIQEFISKVILTNPYVKSDILLWDKRGFRIDYDGFLGCISKEASDELTNIMEDIID